MSNSSIRSFRIRFGLQVATEVIDKLRNTNGTARSPEIAALLTAVGGGNLKPVYTVRPEEVVQDEYGMAREFVLTLDAVADPDKIVSSLTSSGLVDQASSSSNAINPMRPIIQNQENQSRPRAVQ